MKRSYSRISGQTSHDEVTPEMRQRGAQELGAAPLVRRIDVAVQEADRDALDLEPFELGARARPTAASSSGSSTSPVASIRSAHRQAQSRGTSGCGLTQIDVVLVEAALVGDLERRRGSPRW